MSGVTEVDSNRQANNKRVLLTFRTNTQLSSQQIKVMASLTAVLQTTAA